MRVAADVFQHDRAQVVHINVVAGAVLMPESAECGTAIHRVGAFAPVALLRAEHHPVSAIGAEQKPTKDIEGIQAVAGLFDLQAFLHGVERRLIDQRLVRVFDDDPFLSRLRHNSPVLERLGGGFLAYQMPKINGIAENLADGYRIPIAGMLFPLFGDVAAGSRHEVGERRGNLFASQFLRNRATGLPFQSHAEHTLYDRGAFVRNQMARVCRVLLVSGRRVGRGVLPVHRLGAVSGAYLFTAIAHIPLV